MKQARLHNIQTSINNKGMLISSITVDFNVRGSGKKELVWFGSPIFYVYEIEKFYTNMIGLVPTGIFTNLRGVLVNVTRKSDGSLVSIEGCLTNHKIFFD